MGSVKKINILMILPDLSVGGVSMVVLDICNLINQDIFNLHLLLLTKNTDILNIRELKKNISIHYIDYEFVSDYSVFGYYKYIFLSKAAKKNSRKFNQIVNLIMPDIIHFHCNPSELYLGRYLKSIYKEALLYTDHSVRLNDTDYSKSATLALSVLYRYLYKPYNIISVSQTVYSNIIKFKINSAMKSIFLVDNTVDTDFFSPPKNVLNELRVVYISRIVEHKGHRELIEAWGMLKYTGNKKLIIVGPDGLNGSIRKIANDLGLIDTVEFLGSIGNIKEILKNSAIGVFPSHKEGLPIALLEKMSMALPIIVSDIEELTNIVINKTNGLTFKKGNAIDLSEKIDTLLFDENLRDTLGKSARETIIKKYSKRKEIQEITRIYHLLYNLK